MSAIQKMSEKYMWFIGMDPALRADYFGIVVHGLARVKPKTGPWLPKLALVTQLRDDRKNPNYQWIFNEISRGILEPFKNFHTLAVDYSNDRPVGDAMESQYGEDRVIKVKFTKGESGTKMELMQNCLDALNSGYKFPDHTQIKNEKMAENVRILKEQIVNENIELNPDGSIKFKHKGAHNDLLHAWSLSLSPCLNWLRINQGYTGRHHIFQARMPRQNPYAGLHTDYRGLDELGDDARWIL